LKEELTVAENLAHQLALDGLAVPREGLLAALAQFGLLERRDVPARHLSLGQRRRLGLARVSRAQRTLWLLDEPATGLDAIGVSLLEGLLAEHLGQGGMAVLTSHQSIDLPPPIHSLTL
jgi:heme exporter protein A